MPAIHSPGYYRVRLSVLEMFAGELRTQEIDILTNEQSSACGFSFVTGSEYIVFASTNQQTNELWTSHCTRTHELEPGKEDADVSSCGPGGASSGRHNLRDRLSSCGVNRSQSPRDHRSSWLAES